jgi:DNA-binding response OmpR family regulator
MTKNILIVDDEAGILELLKNYLTIHGYDVHVTTNGYRALDLLKTLSVDLIITDIVMSGMDGIEFISELRKEKIDVKIIAMSGGDRVLKQSVYLDIAQISGADAVISKPFDLEEVLETVRKLSQA